MSTKSKPIAVDIFCGAGGLTVGLKKAGFRVPVGVELEPSVISTFKTNHPESHIFKQDVTTITGKDILDKSPTGKIDLLAGCPPCQGFTSLTSKYHRNDKRNSLVLEFARLIEEVNPLCVMMENVPGLAHRGKPLFDNLLESLARMGYRSTWSVLQVADFGVPQSRRRLVLLAGKGFNIQLPDPTHSERGDDKLSFWTTVKETISNLEPPVELSFAKVNGGPVKYDWHVVRSLSPINLQRLLFVKPGASRIDLPKSLRPKCHKKKEKGFGNAYGRMKWDSVSPTITANCTTFSSGRFGHPEQNRTISVREAALLQTFPEDYVFDTPHMDFVCKMIGNALPCKFSEVISRQCFLAIKKHLKNS